MKFLVYSEVNAATIETSLGLPEYSYYFVLREFLPVLERLGEVIVVTEPHHEVDAHYRAAKAAGERCLFLSFSPPHRTTLGLECPTVPIFAWEFDSIPTQSWYDQPEHDWRHGLRLCGKAITHSALTVRTVGDALDTDFPVIAIPAPVWNKFESLRTAAASAPVPGGYSIDVRSGVLFDTRDLSLQPWMPGLDAVAAAVAAARGQSQAKAEPEPAPPSSPAPRASRLRVTLRYLAEWYRLVWRDSLPAPLIGLVERLRGKGHPPAVVASAAATPWEPAPHRLKLEGVVFTAVFNPYDGRKNWVDMLTAFCSAFRDTADATLVFKLGHHEYRDAIEGMLMGLARLPAFRCRVVILHGYLEKAAYESLIHATSYVVNASHGEGQCLPLMEYLSCGKPAVAPRHSAMADYIDEDVAFVVDSWLDATAWPHDPRLAYRTCRHQIDWTSLVQAYTQAYHCFKATPETYAALSRNAIERMRVHCSRQSASERLVEFLRLEETAPCCP
ncbi:MAG: glycosyltransferase [Pseudomonas sp.]